MRFYVYRHGYNSANNSAIGGGPPAVRVAEVEAENADCAILLAREEGISCYNNQFFYAEDADTTDAAKAARKRLVKRV